MFDFILAMSLIEIFGLISGTLAVWLLIKTKYLDMADWNSLHSGLSLYFLQCQTLCRFSFTYFLSNNEFLRLVLLVERRQ